MTRLEEVKKILADWDAGNSMSIYEPVNEIIDLFTPKSEDRLIDNRVIDVVYGNRVDITEHLQAQRDVTRAEEQQACKDLRSLEQFNMENHYRKEVEKVRAECQARVEGIFKKIERIDLFDPYWMGTKFEECEEKVREARREIGEWLESRKTNVADYMMGVDVTVCDISPQQIESLKKGEVPK